VNPYFETNGSGTLCREGGLQVAKRRLRRHTKEFRRIAVERLKSCDNIVALSRELGVHRRLLYQWRDRWERRDSEEEAPPGNARESTLLKEISRLKQVLAEKTLELDFFKGALQKVEARRQPSGISGEKASTTKSKKGCPCKAV
jgi:transposase